MSPTDPPSAVCSTASLQASPLMKLPSRRLYVVDKAGEATSPPHGARATRYASSRVSMRGGRWALPLPSSSTMPTHEAKITHSSVTSTALGMPTSPIRRSTDTATLEVAGEPQHARPSCASSQVLSVISGYEPKACTSRPTSVKSELSTMMTATCMRQFISPRAIRCSSRVAMSRSYPAPTRRQQSAWLQP